MYVRLFLAKSFATLSLLILVASASAQSTLPPVESVDAATRTRWLMDGFVVDADTAKPLKSFTVTPGTMSTDETGRTTVRWRDKLKLEMKNGKLQWPRTSGFSTMRFRVTSPGYRAVITQKVNRGGPHLRINVRMLRQSSVLN